MKLILCNIFIVDRIFNCVLIDTVQICTCPKVSYIFYAIIIFIPSSATGSSVGSSLVSVY